MADIRNSRLLNSALWVCAFLGAGVWAILGEAISRPIVSRLTELVITGDIPQMTALVIAAAMGVVRFLPITCTLWAFSTRKRPDRFSRWRMFVLWASTLLGAMALAAIIVTQLHDTLVDADERVALPVSAANPPAPENERSSSGRAGETAATQAPLQNENEAITAGSRLDPQQQFLAEVMRREPELGQIINDPDWKTFLQRQEGESTIVELLTAAYNRRDLEAVVRFIEAFKLTKYAAATRGVPFTEEERYEDELMRQSQDANAGTYQTSFDCTRARSTPEYLICHDVELATADLLLAQLVQRAQGAVVDKAALAERLRKQWNYRQQKCVDKPCLAAWYAYEQDVITRIAQTGDANATQDRPPTMTAY